MDPGNTGSRNWLVLVFVGFFLGLILLDVSLILGGTFAGGDFILIAGGIPLWIALLAWTARVFVRSRRFYCTTPSCAIIGRKRVFMPRGDAWVCTQCGRPLITQALTFQQQPQPLTNVVPFSGSLGDSFLGGVAGLRIYRFKGRGEVNIVSGWHNPWGYGVYFTDRSMIGVSYTRYLSRAYYPGWILSGAWIAIIAATFVMFAVTHTEELPAWWIPIFPIACFGAMIMSLVFLLYLSPKRASDQIDHIQVNSVRDLETLRKDFILRRDDISEINLRRTKVAEIGHGIYSSGAILSVSSKRSEPVILVTTNREKLEELVELIEDFAERDPPIRLTEN